MKMSTDKRRIKRRRSALLDWYVREIVLAQVFSSRTNQFVIGVLFENVGRPAANATHRKYRRVELKRDPHHVIGRGGEEIHVRIKSLLAHHYFFNSSRHLIPTSVATKLAHLL